MRQALLLLALFSSGAASLILENLWFEWLALHWGRTADASAALLASFMFGLGLGQLLILRLPTRNYQQCLKLWASCEAAVALLAAACQWRFAQSAEPLGLNALLWMLAPTVFMGMTLPLAVTALKESSLSATIGRAYASNTLGAALGCLLAGFYLVNWLGLQQASASAIALQLMAAVLVLSQFRSTASVLPSAIESKATTSKPPLAQNTQPTANPKDFTKALFAVAVSGCFILGMEMLWFRALLLTHRSTAENFALMIAIVLVGLAIGSALASRLIEHRQPKSGNQLVAILLAAQMVLASLGLLLWQPNASLSLAPNALLLLQATLLILPACALSGALFVVASHSSSSASNPTATTAKLVLSSTIGSTIGAPLISLWGLPTIGWTNSLMLLLCLLLIACFANAWRIGAMAAVVISAIAIPLTQHWPKAQNAAAQIYLQLDNASILSQRDGQYQSVQLLESQFLGQPISHRLVTDSYSMTSTAADSERYMRLFAWLPRALHSNLKDVLLISYGAGSTAEALLDNPATQSLVVADPSATMLETSRMIKRPNEPLDDPRVSIQLEDGRKVLSQSANQFDLVTGEPPPPRLAGMHALYSAEYFDLMHQALKPNGIASYWLPVDQLTLASSKAIIKAFCNAFSDCSLWAGSHYNWLLLGSKPTQQQASPTLQPALNQLWSRPQDRQRLLESGFEHPAQLASTFIADSHTLVEWAANTPALNDNWPRRISAEWPSAADIHQYAEWQDNNLAEQRFLQSRFAEQWPLPAQSLQLAWSLQPLLNGQFRPEPEQRMQLLWQLLTLSQWQTPILWLLGTDQTKLQIARQQDSPPAKLHQAVGLLAERNFPAAAQLFDQLGDNYPLATVLADIAKRQP